MQSVNQSSRRSKCTLCLQKLPESAFEDDNSVNPNNLPCYTKVKTRPSFDLKFCSECSSLLHKFNLLHKVLEETRLRMNHYLQEIVSAIQEADDDVRSSLSEYEEHTIHDPLRAELLCKCVEKLELASPILKLRRQQHHHPHPPLMKTEPEPDTHLTSAAASDDEFTSNSESLEPEVEVPVKIETTSYQQPSENRYHVSLFPPKSVKKNHPPKIPRDPLSDDCPVSVSNRPTLPTAQTDPSSIDLDPKRKFKCGRCSKLLSSRSFPRHNKYSCPGLSASKRQRVQCEICKTLLHPESLKLHLRRGLCNNILQINSSKSEASQHSKTKNEPLTCEKCENGTIFKDSIRLAYHLKYDCSKAGQKRDFQSSAGEIKVKCEKCGKLLLKRSLYTHRKYSCRNSGSVSKRGGSQQRRQCSHCRKWLLPDSLYRHRRFGRCKRNKKAETDESEIGTGDEEDEEEGLDVKQEIV